MNEANRPILLFAWMNDTRRPGAVCNECAQRVKKKLDILLNTQISLKMWNNLPPRSKKNSKQTNERALSLILIGFSFCPSQLKLQPIANKLLGAAII